MKLTIKSFLLIISLFIVSALVGCRFKPLPLDEAKTNLENAGYTVRVIEGSEFVESDENPFPMITSFELDKYLVATKGDDEIHLYYFISTSAASNNYEFMSNNKLKSGQNNDLVYFGTKQAITDAGL